jgi:hypothetical protein
MRDNRDEISTARKDRIDMVTIPDLQEALQLVLIDSANERGRSSGWHRRQGQMSPSQFVQTLVFGWLEDPHATLGHLARVAHATGALVTQQAISQRFSESSMTLVRGVLQDALSLLLEADPVAVAVLQAFPGGVYLNDSTQLALHAEWQELWDGGGIAAALKLPTLFDLLRGSLHVDLTPARQHDSVTTLANLDFPPGSLVIEDLGYLDLARMQRRQAAGVDTIVPLRSTLVLADERGRRINLPAWLRRHAQQIVERQVWLHGQCLRLVAVPASPETAARKRQGIREAARKHGRDPNPLTLALAAWIIILTTVATERATCWQIGTLMRLRWQVELVFKLWKDQGKLDETRGWKPERIATEWYAKLLGLLLQHWLVLVTGWQWADRSLVKAGETIREYARCLCLMWRHQEALTWLCEQLSRSIAIAGRIVSHCQQQSAAELAVWA